MPFTERGRNEFEEGNYKLCFTSLTFEMLIRHLGRDIKYADEYVSLEFQKDISARYIKMEIWKSSAKNDLYKQRDHTRSPRE